MRNNDSTQTGAAPLFFYAIAALIILPFLVLQYTYRFGYLPAFTSDYWGHAGAIRAFLDNPLAPHYPMEAKVSIRDLSPYHFCWAVAGKWLHLDPFVILQCAAFVNVACFLFALWQLTTLFETNRIPAYFFLLLIVFSLWGLGAGFSGEYTLYLLPQVAAFPSFFGFTISLFFLSDWVRWTERRIETHRWRVLARLITFSAIVVSCHQLCFIYFLVSATLVFTWCFASKKWQALRALAGIFLIALSLFCLWPFVPVSELLQIAWQKLGFLPTPGSLNPSQENAAEVAYRQTVFYSPRVILNFGPTFLAVPALLLIKSSPLRKALFFLILIPAAGWLLSGFVSWPPLGWRLSAFLVFWLQVALALFLSETFAAFSFLPFLSLRGIVAWTYFIICVVLLLGHVALAGKALRPQKNFALHYLRSDIAEIQARLKPDSYIVGPRDLTWPLRAFGFETAMYFPTQDWTPTEDAKRETVILENPASSKEERCHALKRLGATHYAYPLQAGFYPATAETQLPELSFQVVYQGTMIHLVALGPCQ